MQGLQSILLLFHNKFELDSIYLVSYIKCYFELIFFAWKRQVFAIYIQNSFMDVIS